MSSRFPTTSRPSQRLLVFARVPEWGRVKARLSAELGPERALQIYRAMLGQVLSHTDLPKDEFEVEILWKASRHISGDEVTSVFGDRPLSMQVGATLGDRIVVAFSERVIFHQASKIIAIGTDEPTLDCAFLTAAFDLLDSCDWIVGPADAGGYYLIGCRGDAFHPGIFQEIEWGAPDVFSKTMEKIRERRYTVAVLPHRYDIGRIEDLRRYAAENHAGAIADVLREWGWS